MRLTDAICLSVDSGLSVSVPLTWLSIQLARSLDALVEMCSVLSPSGNVAQVAWHLGAVRGGRAGGLG